MIQAHQIASYIAHILNVYSLPSGSYWLTEFGLWMDSVIKPFKSSDINILPEEEARGWSNYKPPEEKWVMTMNVTKKKKKKRTAVTAQRSWICFVSLPILSVGLLCTCLKMAKGVYFIPWFWRENWGNIHEKRRDDESWEPLCRAYRRMRCSWSLGVSLNLAMPLESLPLILQLSFISRVSAGVRVRVFPKRWYDAFVV